MSSASDEDDREEDLDLFHEFIEEIGGQINKRVFRIMKRLSRNKIPQGKLESFEDPADLITALEETNIICRTNTTYLAHILRVANENKLAKQVEEYPLKHHKGMKRKRTSTDSDVPYKRKYMGRYADMFSLASFCFKAKLVSYIVYEDTNSPSR
ncbi:uncharacterized protein LOC144351781 [Saccoglossus kowalevskii]